MKVEGGRVCEGVIGLRNVTRRGLVLGAGDTRQGQEPRCERTEPASLAVIQDSVFLRVMEKRPKKASTVLPVRLPRVITRT